MHNIISTVDISLGKGNDKLLQTLINEILHTLFFVILRLFIEDYNAAFQGKKQDNM